jgi:hypothetical protein
LEANHQVKLLLEWRTGAYHPCDADLVPSECAIPTGTELRYPAPMPRISTFYGVVVFMYAGDHDPPHFHARYGEHWARCALDGVILDGSLPKRAAGLVSEWAGLHPAELQACWQRSRRYEPPGSIEPLS